jgi:1-deoxy-D-xylulose-5-phosphate reductoisomerase
MKNIALLGSTGSIGVSTLDIAGRFPEKFNIVSLCCGRNIDLLLKQIIKFKPEIAVVVDEKDAEKLKEIIPKDIKTDVLFGDDGFKEAVTLDKIDIVLSAIVGSAGLKPTIEAIYAGKDIALANKESLVASGDIVLNEAKKNNVKILPVDSEHSAIFQALEGNDEKELVKIFLTASGGPFRTRDYADFKDITPKEALNHPTWNMGAKISIDSATLMNKGLEVIEAAYLFDVDPEKIEVVVHPQSIVHSMVGYCDGSIIAQMGVPDMREAISYALSWPKRLNTGLEFPDFSLLDLHFEKPDLNKFRSLKLAFHAAKEKGSLPCVMNAANEVAVMAFLEKMIRFDQIPHVVEEVMNSHDKFSPSSIEEVFKADFDARTASKNFIKKLTE